MAGHERVVVPFAVVRRALLQEGFVESAPGVFAYDQPGDEPCTYVAMPDYDGDVDAAHLLQNIAIQNPHLSVDVRNRIARSF